MFNYFTRKRLLKQLKKSNSDMEIYKRILFFENKHYLENTLIKPKIQIFKDNKLYAIKIAGQKIAADYFIDVLLFQLKKITDKTRIYRNETYPGYEKYYFEIDVNVILQFEFTYKSVLRALRDGEWLLNLKDYTYDFEYSLYEVNMI